MRLLVDEHDDPAPPDPFEPAFAGPVAGGAPPPPPGGPPPAPPGRRRRSPAATVVVALVTVLAVFVAGVGVWGFVHHPGYDEFLPGDAEAVGPLIGVQGAAHYTPKGQVLLVFVRERSNLNEWQYLWAKTFPGDADLLRRPPPSPGTSPLQDVCDMTDSQATAKLVALRKLGYKVTTRPGVLIQQVSGGVPAADILRCNDVIRSVDGHSTDTPDALHAALAKHKPGDVVDIGFDRGTQRLSRSVKLVKDQQTGAPLIGVYVAERFVYPVKLTIDTADIGGPSAGLAMTLALLDELTKGDLTGGQKIAVTGTINADASVGEIGEIRLKAVAARRRGVQMFIVPACTDADARDRARCNDDLAAAKKAAKGVKVIPVKTLDEALRALVADGGDPLPATAAAQ